MIGFLRGILVEKRPPQLSVDVRGVGYELQAPMSTFYVLPELGVEIKLYTHLAVREDTQTLFGFSSAAERALFRTLIKISGVGAKMALAILSGMNAEEFTRCVQEQNSDALLQLPGIGRKTAERLLIEMRDRLPSGEPVAPMSFSSSALPATPVGPMAEAVGALTALGYKPQEASRMLRVVDSADLSTEELIRAALRGAVQR